MTLKKEHLKPHKIQGELFQMNRNYSNFPRIGLVYLEDQRFFDWSGSSKPEQHHYGRHGLMTHTYEVIELCFAVNGVYGLPIDYTELFFSALFHDAGKMYDYAPTNSEMTEWTGTEHKHRIHHISRSALIWSEAVKKHGSPEFVEKYHDAVLHNILAHHQLREWGSPVRPDTRAAWCLHLCDNLSARLYETE
jgi:3'-5' exoribonuclease